MDKQKLVVSRWVPPLALWAATKLLETKPVRKKTNRIENRLVDAQERLSTALEQGRRNIRRNPGWRIAGASAIAVGIGLLTRAAVRK